MSIQVEFNKWWQEREMHKRHVTSDTYIKAAREAFYAGYHQAKEESSLDLAGTREQLRTVTELQHDTKKACAQWFDGAYNLGREVHDLKQQLAVAREALVECASKDDWNSDECPNIAERAIDLLDTMAGE